MIKENSLNLSDFSKEFQWKMLKNAQFDTPLRCFWTFSKTNFDFERENHWTTLNQILKFINQILSSPFLYTMGEEFRKTSHHFQYSYPLNPILFSVPWWQTKILMKKPFQIFFNEYTPEIRQWHLNPIKFEAMTIVFNGQIKINVMCNV